MGAPPTFKIGLVAPFEGLHRPLGYEALFGVKLALQERNLAGGVQGYRVELVALNDFDDPAEAVSQAKALSADPDVLGVIGHLSAATMAVAGPVYHQAQLTLIIPWSAPADLNFEGAGIFSLAANLTETRKHLETINQKMGFNNMTELSDINLNPISDQTQSIYLNTEGVRAGEILLALQAANISRPVLGQVDVGSSQTIQVAKAAANGLVFASPGPDPQHVPQAVPFVKAYQDLAGFPPGPRAVLAYEAAQILLDGIEQVLRINDDPTRAEVGAVIAKVQRSGLTGDIAFDSRGQRVAAPVWIYEITNETYPGTPLVP
jgi:branched-chain amino acid transport system substrate-binding protein